MAVTLPADLYPVFASLAPDEAARLVGTNREFRRYVFRLFAERMSSLMQTIEAVAYAPDPCRARGAATAGPASEPCGARGSPVPSAVAKVTECRSRRG